MGCVANVPIMHTGSRSPHALQTVCIWPRCCTNTRQCSLPDWLYCMVMSSSLGGRRQMLLHLMWLGASTIRQTWSCHRLARAWGNCDLCSVASPHCAISSSDTRCYHHRCNGSIALCSIVLYIWWPSSCRSFSIQIHRTWFLSGAPASCRQSSNSQSC